MSVLTPGRFLRLLHMLITLRQLLVFGLLFSCALTAVRVSESYGKSAPEDDHIVYVVHAVDTESDDRDDSVFNQELVLTNFEPGRGVDQIFDPEWRYAHTDGFGNPVKFTWYLMTHEAHCQSVQGCNAIPEVMLGNFREKIDYWGDEVAWHHHHSDWIDNEWKKLYTFNGTVYREKTDIDLVTSHLAMFVIENGFFPEGYRAGWAWENTDFSNWLENLIIYDFSNIWLNVPPGKNQWALYHPSPDDFKAEGDMARWIGKGKPGANSQADVNDAFELAQTDGKAIICYFTHSYTPVMLKVDTENMEALLHNASSEYGIPFKYVGAKEAMKLWLGETDSTPPIITTEVINRTIHIEADEDLFGVPFLALRHADGDYGGRLMEPDGFRSWKHYLNDSDVVAAVIGVTDLAGNSAVSKELNYFDICTVENPPCGDVNGDGTTNIGEISYLVVYLFMQGQAPCAMNSADVDGSGSINVADLIYLLEYLLKNGPAPVC